MPAAAAGESPEESPEVPEPDLSMELQDQLKRCLTEHESMCAKEQARARRAQPAGAVVSEEEVEGIREKYAEAAVIEMVTTLKSFDPEISKEKLSNDIFSILHSDAVVGHLNAPLRGALRAYVPRDRQHWLADDIERHIAAKRAQLRILREKLSAAIAAARARAAALAANPAARAVLLSASGGATLLGAYGGALGLAGGAATGTLLGTVPALFTFGLSIPAGAALGSGLGAALGSLLGATVGLVGGGAAGGTAYTYRDEIHKSAAYVTSTASSTAATARTRALETTSSLKVSVDTALDSARERAVSVKRTATRAASDTASVAASVVWRTREKAVHAQTAVVDVLSDPALQAGAASAAGGAVLAGAGGGAVGLATGTAFGAACGVVPALFTFGLSIPIGAAIGGGAGLCVGAATGGTAGLVGGGAAGYSAYRHREELSTGLGGARARAGGLVALVRDKATSSASYVKTKLVGDRGGTD